MYKSIFEKVYEGSSVVYAKDVKKQLDVHLKRSFSSCNFNVTTSGHSVIVTLVDGDFEAFVGRRKPISGDLQVRMSYGYKVKELDPKDLFLAPSSGLKLSSDAKNVFAKIVSYIKDNFSDNTEVIYNFYISGVYQG